MLVEAEARTMVGVPSGLDGAVPFVRLSIIRREEMHESSLAQEFVLEGDQIRARKAVLQLLKLRFGEEQSKEFTQTLEQITDLGRLEELLSQAYHARRLSQIRKAISAT
jgi:hypothetical protein